MSVRLPAPCVYSYFLDLICSYYTCSPVNKVTSSILQVYLTGKPIESLGAVQLAGAMNYCPQADTLWPRLTLSEVLRTFARLRGLTSAAAERLIQAACMALRLQAYSDRRFEALSGGTKRKV